MVPVSIRGHSCWLRADERRRMEERATKAQEGEEIDSYCGTEILGLYVQTLHSERYSRRRLMRRSAMSYIPSQMTLECYGCI